MQEGIGVAGSQGTHLPAVWLFADGDFWEGKSHFPLEVWHGSTLTHIHAALIRSQVRKGGKSRAVVAHAFNNSTREAEAGGSL